MAEKDQNQNREDPFLQKKPPGGVKRGAPDIEGVTNHTTVRSGENGRTDGSADAEEESAAADLSPRERYVHRLLTAFRRYYNLVDPSDLPVPDNPLSEALSRALIRRCDFEVRNAQYVLTKNHELWSADSREHCYIFSLEDLTVEAYKALEDYVYTEGMKLIHPKKGHMCTTLTLMIVCETCQPEARKLLKKCHLHKDFRFTLDGWMDFHTALAVLGERRAETNFSGHENKKLLKGLMEKKR